MSVSDTSTEDGEVRVLCDDSDWWGEQDDEPDDEHEAVVTPTDRRWDKAQPTADQRERQAAFIAYRALREFGAEVLCPECLYDRQRPVTLDDPEHYVEPCLVEFDGQIRWFYTDHRRHRACPTCSLITWGGPLSQLETEQLAAAADYILEFVDQKFTLSDSQREKLLNDVRSRKIGADLTDERNLVRMVQDCFSSDELESAA